MRANTKIPSPEPSKNPTIGEAKPAPTSVQEVPVPEIGGPPGPEPTRYGDWEKGGRCTDF